MKRNKFLLYAIGVLILVIIILAIGKNQGWVGTNYAIKVATQTVKKETITELINANGKIQPETEVKITPDVSGEIIELYVEEGQQVQQGQLLVVIKPEVYESTLNRMEASLNSAKARLAQAEAQLIERELSYDRSKQLYERGTIPISEFETVESSYKVAQAEVEAAQYTIKSAEASVEEAEEQLTKTKIYAPISGTVSRLDVEKGERVVGTNMYEGTAMMTIANLDMMEVRVEVNENDIVRVEKYDTALVEVDAYLNRKFKGIVTEIANSANTSGVATDQVTTFEVKVLLLKESYEDLIPDTEQNYSPFRPGMSATVDIQTETRNDIITVPIQAVTTRYIDEDDNSSVLRDEIDEEQEVLDERREVVYVLEDDMVIEKTITSGIQDNNNIEILAGLETGDEVVYAPYNAINRLLKDSMSAQKVDEEELYSTE